MRALFSYWWQRMKDVDHDGNLQVVRKLLSKVSLSYIHIRIAIVKGQISINF